MTFNSEVRAKLKFYVYRLIDPRNGETFYVGKGKDNRVFDHANCQVDEDEVNNKIRTIREIQNSGFVVTHVIHRHGLDEKTALEVEASVMDAYPASTNIAEGHHSRERGVMHAQQVIEKYGAEYAVFRHSMLVINRTAKDISTYDAVRFAWRLSLINASATDYVLAVIEGLIVDVFEPVEWLEATKDNFPDFDIGEQDAGRIGFIGEPAPDHVKRMYIRRRIPENMRKKGAASPVRYTANYQAV